MSLRAATKSGSEPIPGYTLRKRLGAGGYGEVWLADAPGGLQKAVKLIYGTVDQSHATSELRSLQRIRQVYHPFLLSIERIEIVDNQVIIVTELAENSLLDRFEQCRRKGAPGIDRAQLLDFMRDAADALDFLSQKHALQHLDVKPGNLLIIADRIKVADFGLIKDLHDQNQSLVSGLTPTYSAPEIFDGRPDYRSDQYSLAIVYMEMLTGQVPFSGKSTGELARQHLTRSPNLESLPPADRPLVARALAKNPLDRYATCRLFIEQLLKTRGAVLPPQNIKSSETSGECEEEQSTSVQERMTSTASAVCDQQVLQSAIDVRGLQKHWNNSRAMFIGLGGLGSDAVGQLRRLAKRDCDNRLDVDDHAWAVIDTDAKTLNSLTDDSQEDSLPAKHAFELRIFRPSEYRNAPSELFSPLSRRWLYNIPRSLKTEGVRPLAILSLLDHYEPLRQRLRTQISDLIQLHKQDADCQEPLKIYILSSLHGGTGSALLAEMGFLIRRIMCELAFSDYRLCGLASAATTTHNSHANLFSAAGLATLSELNYLMDRDREVESLHFGDKQYSVATAKPFDWVTLVDGGMHAVQSDVHKTIRDLAQLAWLDCQTPLGASLVDSRLTAVNQLSSSQGWLRAAASVPVSVASNVTAARLARWCCEQTLLQALKYMAGSKGAATSCSQPTTAASLGADFPLTPQATEDFVTRMLLDLGIRLAPSKTMPPAEAEAEGQVSAAQPDWSCWSARLASNQETLAAVRVKDRETWRRAIARIVKLRVYNWKQVEQIQLSSIEAIVNFCERDARQLATQLQLAGLDRRDENEIWAALCGYLRAFSEQCLQRVQEFQHEGRKLARSVRSWCESINAEKALNEAAWDVNLSGLPPKLQLLANRVSAVLESTIHHLASQQVGIEAAQQIVTAAEPKKWENKEISFNLRYMLGLSTELVGRIAAEMGITDEELNGCDSSSDPAFSFNQIATYFPAITQCGAKVFRFVITPIEQEQVALQALKAEHLEGKTTLIGARRSLESMLVCDACELKLHQLVSSLWRPCQPTLQLAERLRTRIDVDWYPADKLLEAPLLLACVPAAIVADGGLLGPLSQPGTLALPASASPAL